MGLRERLTKVTQVFHRVRTKGHQLREDDEGGKGGSSSTAEQSSQREARRRGGMTAEDRAWEQASLQRNRDRQARSSEPTISADEPTISGETQAGQSEEATAMRTVWDVLTSLGPGIRVTHPHRPSHALVILQNGWQVSLTVSPASSSELGQRLVSRSNVAGTDLLGREGSPEGWFDRTHDADVAIVRPAGAWFHCTAKRLGDVAGVPVQPYLSAEEIARLIARIARLQGQSAACVCPDCHAPAP